jgi:hypothetical protein
MSRVFAIVCGDKDADDLDALRNDPGLRPRTGQAARTGRGARQSTEDEPPGECTDHARSGQDNGRNDRQLPLPAAPAIGSSLHHRRNIEEALKCHCKADFFNKIAAIATTYS